MSLVVIVIHNEGFGTKFEILQTKSFLKILFMRIKILALLAFLAPIIIISCQKEAKSDSNSGTARLQVSLTDDPGNYQAVFIDVQDIKINLTNDSLSGWQSLANVNTGQYDLLRLVNDDDTVLVNADIPTGRIHQIRLILGPDNFVMIDSQLIRLETPSAQQSGLKINIQQDITAGILYKLLLDFDVARSIVKTGNNKYILKPLIRAVMEATGGTIKGVVLPDTVLTSVLAIKGTDTTGTFTGTGGGYQIRGLAAGTYSLHFFPTSDTTFLDEVRNNIIVTTGNVTVADTVILHH